MTVVSNYAVAVVADANPTRQKLLAAGERLFATRGIHGAQLRDIVRAAGQANDSAIHYHFGSRDGLLAAICARHLAEMEPDRERRLAAQGADPDISVMVADLIRPAAERLRTQSGRYFLQITRQLAGHSGVRGGTLPPIVSEGLRRQLEEVQRACGRSMPAEVARERVAVMIGALTAALADRAVAIDEGARFALDEEAFVANLEAMQAAGLRAPLP